MSVGGLNLNTNYLFLVGFKIFYSLLARLYITAWADTAIYDKGRLAYVVNNKGYA